MSRVGRVVTSVVLVGTALPACTSARDDAVGLPDATASTMVPPFEPAPIPASAQPLVDGLIANLTDGVSLLARVDASAAPCVARRWVGILDPAALTAAGTTAETMASLTLAGVSDLLPAPLDEVRANALIESFAICDVTYDEAVLSSMRAAGTVDDAQRSCIAEALPADLLTAASLRVLREQPPDPTIQQQYQTAVGPCLEA